MPLSRILTRCLPALRMMVQLIANVLRLMPRYLLADCKP
ncbi:MAG: hypothetical protein GPOALKHO_000350 [Sodalis sp.]|nr:MAG: hypothetical protein GPOALKHO_000350 [Sodalis sp.]